jgi:hypothetical protein
VIATCRITKTAAHTRPLELRVGRQKWRESMIQTKVRDRFNDKSLFVHETELLEQEARIALDMIVKIGFATAIDDGEDTTGRHKLKLMTPEEVVERAFKISSLFMATAREKKLTYNAADISAFETPVNKKGIPENWTDSSSST